jgi:hypothetical protein
MFDPTSENLPFDWKRKAHYTMRIVWMTNEKSEQQKSEDRELLEALASEDVPEELLEFEGRHKGWHVLFNVSHEFHTSSKDALKQARRVIAHSELKPGKFNFGLNTPSQAPVQLSKDQRAQAIALLEQSTSGQEDILKEIFLEFGTVALNAWIEDAAFREEFKTLFKAPSNPLRSLVGYNVVVSHGIGDDEWNEIAEGTLELDENTVRVGDWSRTFSSKCEVEGVAFFDTSLYEPASDGLYDHINARDERLKDES